MTFHGDLRVLLIGFWHSVERAGGKPTIEGVARAARSLGAIFDDDRVLEILSTNFRDLEKQIPYVQPGK